MMKILGKQKSFAMKYERERSYLEYSKFIQNVYYALISYLSFMA